MATVTLATLVALVVPAPFLPNPFVLLFGVVAVSAWHGGLRRRLALMISIAVVSGLSLLPALDSSIRRAASGAEQLIVFFLSILLITAINAAFRYARRAAAAYDSLELTLQHQAALTALNARALSDAPLDQLLAQATRTATDILAASRAAILDVPTPDQPFVLRAAVGAGWPPVGMPLDAGGDTEPARRAIVSGDLVLEEHARGVRRWLPSRRSRGEVSAWVPIPGPGAPYGVLAVHYPPGPGSPPVDAEFLWGVANVIARVVARERLEEERARLIHAQAARIQAEEARRRQVFLAEASTHLSSTLAYEEVPNILTRLAVPVLADWCVVHLTQEDGTVRWVAGSQASPEQEACLRRLAEEYPRDGACPESTVAAVIRANKSAVFADVRDEDRTRRARDARHLELLRQAGTTAAMIIPASVGERVLGAVSFMRTGGQPYLPEDAVLAEDLTRRFALALENARLYQEAQRAISARDRFLSIAAHELRGPLARVKSHVEVLQARHEDGDLDGDGLIWSLARMAESVDRLTMLAADLLDVSRLQTGHMPLRRQPVDLAALVRVVVDAVERQANSSAGTFDVRATSPRCVLDADEAQMEQVITNLLDNARKYSPDGGTVTIDIHCDADGALLRVRDEGIGLPAGVEHTIFEPFGRAQNAIERNLPGLGLGLYLCRQIIERHDGHITAASPGEGRGTTISVWLPGGAAGEPVPAEDDG